MGVDEVEVERHLPLTPTAFEILLSLADDDLHGYAIMLAIEERTDGRLSLNPGTLYRALDRLVSQGLLERVRRDRGDRGDWGKQGASGAEPQKFFRLSKLGARVAEAEARRLADQVDAARARALFGEAGGEG